MPIPSFMRVLCLITLLMQYLPAPCHATGDYYEVVDVRPSKVINHEVYVRGPFDESAVETFLTGPQRFAHVVVFGKSARQGRTAFLNWYRITKPTTEPTRQLLVRDASRGNQTAPIRIKDAVFLLSPAQRITTGPPSPIPERLNYFKAYRIVDPDATPRTVSLRHSLGPEQRTAKRAAFLCVPVEHRHHDERTPIKNERHCMLVYELLPVAQQNRVTTMDQFGLNRLTIRSSHWLAVPAEIVEVSPMRSP